MQLRLERRCGWLLDELLLLGQQRRRAEPLATSICAIASAAHAAAQPVECDLRRDVQLCV